MKRPPNLEFKKEEITQEIHLKSCGATEQFRPWLNKRSSVQSAVGTTPQILMTTAKAMA